MPDSHLRGFGTRALLDALTVGPAEEVLELGRLLDGLGRRGFGVLLFLAVPPAFFPGVAAVLGSPLVILVGLQLLLHRPRVWLPRRLAHRGPQRQLLIRFETRFAPWLTRLERWVRPRWPVLIDHPAASMFSGLLLVLLGILLALPIPFTNIPFAALLLLFALALLERDGRLMVLCWMIGSAAVFSLGVVSGELAALAARWVDITLL
ncbi:exopolysaccharide biosynthesis protein [Luteimonas sp. e5]